MANEPGQGNSDLVTIQNLGVQYLGQLIKAIQTVFPQMGGTSTSATGGSRTLPSQPAGFIITTLPNGTTVKVPYYNQ